MGFPQEDYSGSGTPVECVFPGPNVASEMETKRNEETTRTKWFGII